MLQNCKKKVKKDVKVSKGFIVGSKGDVNNKIILTPEPDTWTNKDVTVTVTYGKNVTLNKTLESDGKINTDYIIKGVENVVVKTNGKTITATATDIAGNKVIERLKVENIDKVLPTVALNPNGGNYKMPEAGNATIEVKLTAKDEGGSGLNKLEYAWSTSNTEEPKEGWTEFDDNQAIKKTDCKAETYYLWTRVTDIAGNRAEEVKVSEKFEVTKLENPMEVSNKTVKVGETIDLSSLVSKAQGNVSYSIKSQTTQGSNVEGKTLKVGVNSETEDNDKTI